MALPYILQGKISFSNVTNYTEIPLAMQGLSVYMVDKFNERTDALLWQEGVEELCSFSLKIAPATCSGNSFSIYIKSIKYETVIRSVMGYQILAVLVGSHANYNGDTPKIVNEAFLELEYSPVGTLALTIAKDDIDNPDIENVSVLIDNYNAGGTLSMLLSLRTGVHSLTIRSSNYIGVLDSFTIVENQTTTINKTLVYFESNSQLVLPPELHPGEVTVKFYQKDLSAEVTTTGLRLIKTEISNLKLTSDRFIRKEPRKVELTYEFSSWLFDHFITCQNSFSVGDYLVRVYKQNTLIFTGWVDASLSESDLVFINLVAYDFTALIPAVLENIKTKIYGTELLQYNIIPAKPFLSFLAATIEDQTGIAFNINTDYPYMFGHAEELIVDYSEIYDNNNEGMYSIGNFDGRDLSTELVRYRVGFYNYDTDYDIIYMLCYKDYFTNSNGDVVISMKNILADLSSVPAVGAINDETAVSGSPKAEAFEESYNSSYKLLPILENVSAGIIYFLYEKKLYRCTSGDISACIPIKAGEYTLKDLFDVVSYCNILTCIAQDNGDVYFYSTDVFINNNIYPAVSLDSEIMNISYKGFESGKEKEYNVPGAVEQEKVSSFKDAFAELTGYYKNITTQKFIAQGEAKILASVNLSLGSVFIFQSRKHLIYSIGYDPSESYFNVDFYLMEAES